jgi:transposase
VINVEDWAEIRRLHRAEGCSIKEIARRLGLARNTVRSALRSEGPPKLERPARPSALDAFEPAIRALLGEFPRMPANVIAERVGWERSASMFRARVAELRPACLPPVWARRSMLRSSRPTQRMKRQRRAAKRR